MRERFFTPRVRVRSYEEQNALLLDQVIAYAKAEAKADGMRPQSPNGGGARAKPVAGA